MIAKEIGEFDQATIRNQRPPGGYRGPRKKETLMTKRH